MGGARSVVWAEVATAGAGVRGPGQPSSASETQVRSDRVWDIKHCHTLGGTDGLTPSGEQVCL